MAAPADSNGLRYQTTFDRAIIDHLEKHPGDLDVRDGLGQTLLAFAAEQGRGELVTYCIAKGADLDAREEMGMCVVDYAVTSSSDNSELILAQLLKAGADPNNDKYNDCFERPLHLAARRGHLKKAEMLIQYGARVDAHLGIDNGETPLCYAVRSNQVEMVEFLLSKGAATSYAGDAGAATPPEDWIDWNHRNAERISDLLKQAERKPTFPRGKRSQR